MSAVAAGLASCITAPSNLQSPTATEMLLPRHAARAAAARVNLMCRPPAADHCIAIGSRVFIATLAGDETPAGRFTAFAVREHLGGAGAAIVDDRASAQVIVELGILAAGIDDEDLVVGLPAMAIPAVPGKTASTTMTPSIGVYSRDTRTGAVELEARAVDAVTHRTITAVGPLEAQARLVHGSILTGISFGRRRELPASVER